MSIKEVGREMAIIVYSTKQCPKCKILKSNLDKVNIEYKELNIEDTDVATDLTMRNIAVLSAPMLEINGMIFKYEGE